MFDGHKYISNSPLINRMGFNEINGELQKEGRDRISKAYLALRRGDELLSTLKIIQTIMYLAINRIQ